MILNSRLAINLEFKIQSQMLIQGAGRVIMGASQATKTTMTIKELIEDLVALSGEPYEKNVAERCKVLPNRLNRWKNSRDFADAMAFIGRYCEEYNIPPGTIEKLIRKRLLNQRGK